MICNTLSSRNEKHFADGESDTQESVIFVTWELNGKAWCFSSGWFLVKWQHMLYAYM